MIRAFRHRYGGSPAHLGGHLALFLIAAYALAQMLELPSPFRVVAWLVGAVLLHDFVLMPLYAGFDRVLPRTTGMRGVPVVNHIRVPAMLAGLTLLVFFPPILGLNSTTFRLAAGHAPSGYARDWVLLAVGFALISALVYAVRVVRAPR